MASRLLQTRSLGELLARKLSEYEDLKTATEQVRLHSAEHARAQEAQLEVAKDYIRLQQQLEVLESSQCGSEAADFPCDNVAH